MWFKPDLNKPACSDSSTWMTTYMGRDAESPELGRDAESLEHDVRHALVARLQDRRRQVQTAETSTSWIQIPFKKFKQCVNPFKQI